MTSELCHVLPISNKNKSARETPPRPQFLSYDQLSYMKWHINNRATKLLSRTCEILKISKNRHFQHSFLENSKNENKKRNIC